MNLNILKLFNFNKLKINLFKSSKLIYKLGRQLLARKIQQTRTRRPPRFDHGHPRRRPADIAPISDPREGETCKNNRVCSGPEKVNGLIVNWRLLRGARVLVSSVCFVFFFFFFFFIFVLLCICGWSLIIVFCCCCWRSVVLDSLVLFCSWLVWLVGAGGAVCVVSMILLFSVFVFLMLCGVNDALVAWFVALGLCTSWNMFWLEAVMPLCDDCGSSLLWCWVLIGAFMLDCVI